MRSKEFMDKDVFALDEKIGKVKEIGIDPEEWKITHLEIELEKNIAESVLGAKKGGVRNMLAISALEKGVARWTDKGLHLKVSKDQLHMYLRPVVETLIEGVCYEHMVNDCHYYFDTLVSWVLCFARRRCIDTYTTRDCRNLCSRLAINWQKTVEITTSLFFVKFSSKTIIQITLEK